MKISALLFRFRYWLLALIFILGYWSPWERMAGAHPGTTWLFLAGALARYRILPIAYSSTAVMGVAILLAVLAAMLRTWGEIFLWNSTPSAKRRLAAGLWVHGVALAVLMPTGGAIFSVVAMTVVIVAPLSAKDAPRQDAPAAGQQVLPAQVGAGWPKAILCQFYFWGVALSYIALAGRYNVVLLEQGVLISLGIAVVLQGLLRPAQRML